MAATRQAIMGQGLPPEAPWVVFDYPLFLVDSDLSPIKEKYSEIVAALTKWQPKNTKTGVFNKAPVEVNGIIMKTLWPKRITFFCKTTGPTGSRSSADEKPRGLDPERNGSRKKRDSGRRRGQGGAQRGRPYL